MFVSVDLIGEKNQVILECGILHIELRTFLNFSWVIVMHHFVGFFSNVYLKIIGKHEIDHHVRDRLTQVRS